MATLTPEARQALNRLTGRNVIRTEAYPSSSSHRTYTVSVYADGSKSCNCPGWTRRHPPTGRTCRHVQ